jgi:hypothetical protein
MASSNKPCNDSNLSAEFINDLRSDVNTLYKTVYQGNGVPSLVTQVSKLETRIDTLNQRIDTGFKSIDNEMQLKFKHITDVVNERFNLISYQISDEFAKKRTESASRWSFRTSTITAGIAGFCSVLSIFFAEFIKNFR